jgi:GPH family glycoside/pentoside/hexuronide:cation symporter
MGKNTPQFGNFERLGYGAGELGPAMAGSTIIFFQLVFLTDVAGMNPGLAGSVLLIARIWDAVNDPLIGWLSDHTRTPWGRRLPWMVVSALPFSGLFLMFWLVPDFAEPDAQWQLFLYYLAVAILYSSFATALGLPHSSLTAELSRDYDERSRLTAYRMGFSLAGSVGGLLVALIVFHLMKDGPKTIQYAVFGVSVAVISLLSVVFCLGAIWRIAVSRDRQRVRRQESDEVAMKPLSLREQLDLLVANRPFLLVCGIYLCSWLAMQFTATVLPFYTQSWLRLPATTFQLLALTVQATALCLMPFWGWVSVRQAKIRLLCGHDLLAACASRPDLPPARRYENHFSDGRHRRVWHFSLLSYPQRHAARRYRVRRAANRTPTRRDLLWVLRFPSKNGAGCRDLRCRANARRRGLHPERTG